MRVRHKRWHCGVRARVRKRAVTLTCLVGHFYRNGGKEYEKRPNEQENGLREGDENLVDGWVFPEAPANTKGAEVAVKKQLSGRNG